MLLRCNWLLIPTDLSAKYVVCPHTFFPFTAQSVLRLKIDDPIIKPASNRWIIHHGTHHTPKIPQYTTHRCLSKICWQLSYWIYNSNIGMMLMWCDVGMYSRSPNKYIPKQHVSPCPLEWQWQSPELHCSELDQMPIKLQYILRNRYQSNLFPFLPRLYPIAASACCG